ncbi:hypothetical protein BJV77DRAFT_1151424 [Russula vinacea]|nr:hypothetical protein BJV77DRAFT_1151424 [Russula vinacea]
MSSVRFLRLLAAALAWHTHLLERFLRVSGYFSQYPRTAGMTDAIVEVMVEVLCVLAIATKESKQTVRKLVGRRDVENALQRLENMTLEETRMTGAETLKAIHGVKGVLQGVTDMLQSVDDRVKVIGDKVISGVEETEQQTENVISDRADEVHGQRGGSQAGGDFGDIRIFTADSGNLKNLVPHIDRARGRIAEGTLT